MLQLFLQFEYSKIKKYFSTRKVAKIITTTLFLVVFSLLAAGVYSFLVFTMKSLQFEAEEGIRVALSLFLYEVFLLLITGLIVISSIISSLFNLFRTNRNNWIMSSPAYTKVPLFILLKSVVSSLLLAAVFFIPAVLALEKIYSFGFAGIFSLCISVILLLVVITAITHSLVLIVSKLYFNLCSFIPRIQFTFGRLIVSIVSLIAVVLYFVWKSIRNVDLLSIFKGDEVSSVVTISNMAAHFELLPTHPFAMEILYWQLDSSDIAYVYLFRLLVLSIVSVIIWKLSTRFYYQTWKSFQEIAVGKRNSLLAHVVPQTPFLFTGTHGIVLFKKELLVALRNYKGILWLLFLLMIWVAQIAANVIINHNVRIHQLDMSPKTISIHITEYLIALYFVSAFTLRFVFPSFSTERKTLWVLRSAPLEFTKIFTGKFIFFTTSFVVLGLVMSNVNSLVFSLPGMYTLYSSILFVFTTFVIVSFGLVLGALFPNTETDDAEAISTSVPGLFFTGVSLIYAAASGAALYYYLSKGTLYPLYAFVALTLGVVSTTLIVILKKRLLRFKENEF